MSETTDGRGNGMKSSQSATGWTVTDLMKHASSRILSKAESISSKMLRISVMTMTVGTYQVVWHLALTTKL